MYLSVIVSLSDYKWVQREKCEEIEGLDSASFNEDLQELQQLSFTTDSGLEVRHILLYDYHHCM